MSLPHVVLGLLQESPRTGYELERAIASELDPVWRAGFSQIYPVLAWLRRRGWVLLRVLGPRRGPSRRLYRTTAAGRRELRRWLLEAPAFERRNDEGLSRIALLAALPPPDRRRVLGAAQAAIGAEIARLGSLPSADAFRTLARRASIAQLEGRRRELAGARSATDRTSSPRPAARAPRRSR